MAFGKQESDQQGVATLIARMADGLGKLFTEHLALAKLELKEDAKHLGTQAGMIAAFVPFLFVGYTLLCAALGMFLAQWIGAAGGLAVVGGLNVVGGGLGIWRALVRLKTHKVLGDTFEELNRTAAVLTSPEPAQKTLGNGHTDRPLLTMERAR